MGTIQLSELVRRYGKTTVEMTTGGFEGLVGRHGGKLQGFSLRSCGQDSMLVIRADFPDVPKVAFVYGSTGAYCLMKAFAALQGEGLQWVPDKYRK